MKTIWAGTKKAFFWFFSSFNAKNDGGSSARKWTAFAIMICVFKLHKYHVTPQNADTFLMYDLIAVLMLLGIITAQQIISAKNSASTEVTPEKKSDNV